MSIIYENKDKSSPNYDMAQFVSVITDLQSKVSHLETRVKLLEKKLEKPKFEKLHLLFQKLGLLQFYQKFEKEHIDYDTLKELYEIKELTELRTLIPSIGEYLNFSKKIKIHFNQDNLDLDEF